MVVICRSACRRFAAVVRSLDTWPQIRLAAMKKALQRCEGRGPGASSDPSPTLRRSPAHPIWLLDVRADDDPVVDRVGAGEVPVAPIRLEGIQVHAHGATAHTGHCHGILLGGGETCGEVLEGTVEVL